MKCHECLSNTMRAEWTSEERTIGIYRVTGTRAIKRYEKREEKEECNSFTLGERCFIARVAWYLMSRVTRNRYWNPIRGTLIFKARLEITLGRIICVPPVFACVIFRMFSFFFFFLAKWEERKRERSCYEIVVLLSLRNDSLWAAKVSLRLLFVYLLQLRFGVVTFEINDRHRALFRGFSPFRDGNGRRGTKTHVAYTVIIEEVMRQSEM